MYQSREPKTCDSPKPYALPFDKLSEFYWRWLKLLLLAFFLLASLLLVFYATFSSQIHFKCPNYTTAAALTDLRIHSPPAAAPTNISHILFGIAGSVATWQKRRQYSELWWRPGLTRGFVWLDREPPREAAWPAESPPYRVSEDVSRFGSRRSAVRIARILAESVRMGAEGVRWYVMGDDDTVFFAENLVTVLGRYDHEEFYYVGSGSESVEQDVMHSYGMAFGGGGFAISHALARELARVLDSCLGRYASFYGSDQRVHACLTEFGVPLTLEPGFHQVDLRGSVYGLLAAHPMSPLVTLHHLDYVDPLIPRRSQHDALRSLLGAARLDPGRVLQQSFCYDGRRNWSVSVGWAYTAQIYPSILSAKDLSTPLRTFRTWRSFHDNPFVFNTRPWGIGACDRPLVYFVDGAVEAVEGGTRSTYSRNKEEDPKNECARPEYAAPLKMERITVFAPRMMPDEWRKASRRYCCDVHGGAEEKKEMEVRIRKCKRGESLSPP